MESVVQILEAEKLAPVMYIPEEMRNSILEVTIRPVENTIINENISIKTDNGIMQKFRKAAESREAKDSLEKKMEEGIQFNFDAVKLIKGKMTEEDWQKLYSVEKQAWNKAATKKAGN